MPTTGLPEIRIQNTLTGRKDIFAPRTPGKVSFYACGPTVYGYAHVGNAKTAVTMDLIRRVFEFAGYEVDMMRNITDIDDKIIKRANEEERPWTSVVEEFTKAYDDEMSALGVRRPTHLPAATGHVKAIMSMIQDLIDMGFAYPADTPFGTDVYFRVKHFEGYGKLSKRQIDDLVAGARIEPGEMKEDPLDFALWKSAKPGEPSWDREANPANSWEGFDGWKHGAGRPGWHIECSAMIRARYPEGIDIHGGGLDLVFPHHENEIAQSEACTGHPLARYWVHSGLLVFGKEKMSKSLGNIVTAHDFLATYSPEVLRLMTTLQHYRSPVDFAEESILRAEGLLERLYVCKQNALAAGADAGAAIPSVGNAGEIEKKLRDALFDDFNTAKALGFVLQGARACFRESKPELWATWGTAALPILAKAMGLLEREPTEALASLRAARLKRMGVTEEFSRAIDAELAGREAARAAKNFAESDRIRNDLDARGIQVMDGPDGATWTLKAPLQGAK